MQGYQQCGCIKSLCSRSNNSFFSKRTASTSYSVLYNKLLLLFPFLILLSIDYLSVLAWTFDLFYFFIFLFFLCLSYSFICIYFLSDICRIFLPIPVFFFCLFHLSFWSPVLLVFFKQQHYSIPELKVRGGNTFLLESKKSF